MSTKNIKRGFDPDDVKIFSNESIEELKIAQEEIQWLLDRGYKIKQIIEFTIVLTLYGLKEKYCQ